jgi:hypothetical protein
LATIRAPLPPALLTRTNALLVAVPSSQSNRTVQLRVVTITASAFLENGHRRLATARGCCSSHGKTARPQRLAIAELDFRQNPIQVGGGDLACCRAVDLPSVSEADVADETADAGIAGEGELIAELSKIA